jgi:hypothetical protein
LTFIGQALFFLLLATAFGFLAIALLISDVGLELRKDWTLLLE